MLKEFLVKNEIRFETDISLSEQTTFRIGGVAEIIIYPDTEEKALSLIRFLKNNHMDYFVMGNGSNLLFSDRKHTIPIIKTDDLTRMESRGDTFVFGAGVKMAKAAVFAADHSYSGMEFAHGIPGSIGGAVYMNAGAYDGTMSQIVTETRYIDENGNLSVVKGEEHDFGYRHSCFSGRNTLILDTIVSLEKGDRQTIKDKMADFMQRRKEKQPLHLPSAGSTFKRPEGAFAGKLIQDCGLKGFQIGGAAVSEKHAGFVVNLDNATFRDVKDLIEFVQKKVKEETGYFLACEVEIIE